MARFVSYFRRGKTAGAATLDGKEASDFQLTTYAAVTGTYTVLSTDYAINCTSGTFTVTLLTAVGRSSQIFNIKNSGTGVITIATTSAQTIDGQASGTITLNQYEAITVQSNGANWLIL